MITEEMKSERLWNLHPEKIRSHLESYCSNGRKQFKKIIRSYIFLHLFFIALLFTETIGFCCLLALFSVSTLIAFALAGIILTGFTYLILLLYFQTKKPEEFLRLRNWFLKMCREELPSQIEQIDYHLSIANAAYRFASHLSQEETPGLNMGPVNLLMKRFSNHCLQKDIHKMKEILLFVSINEHIQVIKNTPTNLEAHASLANAYIALSRLYKSSDELPIKRGEEAEFKASIEKALQEFKIIDYYSPNDPWTYAQLASCYHELQMYGEEMGAYEVILKLCPNDKEVMFRLGILYFQHGRSAQALEIYDQLKKVNFSRADELIDFYDADPSPSDSRQFFAI